MRSMLCCVENKSAYLAKEHHFSYAALWSGYVSAELGIVIPNLALARALTQ